MDTVTHALLPVIADGLYERSYLVPEKRRGVFLVKMLTAIDVFGAAPDILDPHTIATWQCARRAIAQLTNFIVA